MTQTLHPNGVIATSHPEGDVVVITQQHGSGSLKIEKDVLTAIVMSHALLRDQPRLGQSRYRTADAQILEARAEERIAVAQHKNAEAEIARLRAALVHIEAMGTLSRMVGGDSLALYCERILAGATS